ncbi:hypothetical protein Dimus_029996 [Dionaea muscipula]
MDAIWAFIWMYLLALGIITLRMVQVDFGGKGWDLDGQLAFQDRGLMAQESLFSVRALEKEFSVHDFMFIWVLEICTVFHHRLSCLHGISGRG